jgi:hypothetical protein
MTTQDAIEHLKQQLHSDPDYAHGWYCNLVMPMHDSGIEYKKGMEAADRILSLFFRVSPPQYRNKEGKHPSCK